MNTVEKRDFIHSHLHQMDENTINDLYEKLQKVEVLKEKLTTRAFKSEDDIQSGNISNRSELERRIS